MGKIMHMGVNYSNSADTPESLANLTDVQLTTPTDGQAIVYDSTSGKFVNGEVSSVASFSDLTDVSISSPTNGQVPVYNSTSEKWENSAISSGGLSPHLFIYSDAGSSVNVTYPDGIKTITPTQVSGSTTQWECDIDGYGIYTITSTISGTTLTTTVNVDNVKEYIVHAEHYYAYFNVYAPVGSSIEVTDNVETFSGVGAGSTATAFTVHRANTAYSIKVTLDGIVKTTVQTTATQSGLSYDITISYGTINLTFDTELRDIDITCTDGTTTIIKRAPSTGNTMTFYPPNTGVWSLSALYNNKTYTALVNATVRSLGVAVSAELNVYSLFGFSVTDNGTDNVVSYQVQYNGRNVDNYDYDSAYMDFDNDVWVWGSWSENEFFMPRPCLISQDYSSKIYLNPYDNTKDVDGNDVTSYLTGASGSYNAMMEWGKNGRQIWYKFYLDGYTSSSNYTCYISDIKLDDGFHAWSFYNQNDQLINHFYTSIYGASNVISSKVLRSVSNRTRNCNTSGGNQITYAKANNKNSETYAWYIDVFADRILINLLLTLITKSTNSDVVGYGNYTGGSQSTILQTGLGNKLGLFYGKHANSVCKVFGMENWWSDINRRMAGLILVTKKIRYKLTYGTADGTKSAGYVEDSSTVPNNYIVVQYEMNASSGSYLRYEWATLPNGVLTPHLYGDVGSNGVYYSDTMYYSTDTSLSNYYYAQVGGSCDYAARCGAWYVRLDQSLITSNWWTGCALTLKPAHDT